MGLEKKRWTRRLSDYGVTLAYSNMVTVPHKMVGLERMLDYRGVRFQKLHCTYTYLSAQKGLRYHIDSTNDKEQYFSGPGEDPAGLPTINYSTADTPPPSCKKIQAEETAK